MRFSTATLLLTVALLAGCRQTTGVNSAGPLVPVNPLAPTGNSASLTPLNSGQTPVLGPFGGATRVTPPPSGSYSAPNNYMGGGQVSAPAMQPGMGIAQSNSMSMNPNHGGVNNQWDGGWNAPIGSGVQQTGGISPSPQSYGTQNFQNQGNTVPGGYPNQPSFPPSQPGASGIRSGGMQPIDLTGAPSPPGYQPQMRSFPSSQQPNLTPAPVPQSNTSPTWRTPQIIVAPSQANIATAPSTEPIDGQDLQWRRPQ